MIPGKWWHEWNKVVRSQTVLDFRIFRTEELYITLQFQSRTCSWHASHRTVRLYQYNNIQRYSKNLHIHDGGN